MFEITTRKENSNFTGNLKEPSLTKVKKAELASGTG